MPDIKLTDNDIKKALEDLKKCNNNEIDCGNCTLSEFYPRCPEEIGELALDLINRLEAENKKFKERQKPTGASGYKNENGNVVFFTNMLGGYRYEYKDLDEVVKTLNELLHEAYSKNEIVFALKCKTEELETAKADIKKLTSGKCVYLSDDETTEYCVEGPCPVYKTEAKIKANAIIEFAELVKKHSYFDPKDQRNVVAEVIIDHYLKEMVGEKE